ncbi:MAG: SDR family NAD(P)-dependent oxidoreductase [Desulfovibrionaceae bacterium]
MNSFFTNKRILVTGCCGTIGRELTKQLMLTYGAAEVLGIDNNESELFFAEQHWLHHDNIHFSLGDIRDLRFLSDATQGVDIIFHSAAFKHVGLCEKAPMQAIQNNIHGLQNIIEAAGKNKVGRVIFTSSDKAVNPTSVMGTTKLMGERLMTAASNAARDSGTIYASTRFGNVLGSRGSVIPIFREQIRRGGPVTLTDKSMTRFIMSIEQAGRLVVDSSLIARGGEVFIVKMPVIQIRDLVDVMIRELAPLFGHDPDNVRVETIGARPGEKMHEELMSMEETRRTFELERYFIVMPPFRKLTPENLHEYPNLKSKHLALPYHSCNESPLQQEELRDYLNQNNLQNSPDEPQHFSERNWP